MNVNKVSLTEAANIIAACGSTNTFILRGQPGVGKSSVLKMLSDRLPDYMACYIDVANLDLGDLGMPVIDRERMVTNYAPNARFGIAPGQKRPVLLMLDELGKAPRSVLNMLLPVILEHRLGDVALPVGSIVFATTNLDTDGVGDNIPAHAYNRMSELVVANPDTEQWLQWASANDIAPEVMAFVKQTPEVMVCYTDMAKGDKNPYIFDPLTGNTRLFCSPRSLEKASHIIKQRAMLGDALQPALAGTIGASAANQMMALVSLADALPDFATIVASPEKAKVPKEDSVAAQFLLAFILAARVTEETLDAVMTYQARIHSFEARALLMATVATNAAKAGFACRNRAFTKEAAAIGKFF